MVMNWYNIQPSWCYDWLRCHTISTWANFITPSRALYIRSGTSKGNATITYIKVLLESQIWHMVVLDLCRELLIICWSFIYVHCDDFMIKWISPSIIITDTPWLAWEGNSQGLYCELVWSMFCVYQYISALNKIFATLLSLHLTVLTGMCLIICWMLMYSLPFMFSISQR